MSSTSNLQNVLSNVVRPVYVYDTATSNYTTKVVLSNVDTFSGNSINVGKLELNDSNNNLYLGVGAGSSDFASKNNVGIGYGATQNNSSTQNSVFVGYLAGGASVVDVSATVAIGANTLAGGSSNVYIGHGTGSSLNTSVGNVLVGPGLTAPDAISNQVRIGNGSNVPLSADMNQKFVGINTIAPQYTLDISGTSTTTVQVRNRSGTAAVRVTAGTSADSSGISLFQSATDQGLTSSSTLPMSFTTNGTKHMTILSNGNVGIGTDTPSYAVDVSGIVRATGFIGTGTSGSAGGVLFSNGTVAIADGAVAGPALLFQNDSSLGLYRPGANTLGFVSGGSNRMTLSNDSLGIGTTAPAYLLDVSGTTQTQNALVTGYLRTPGSFDVSGGNISNSGASTTNTLYTRNLYAPSTNDVSAISYISMGTGVNGAAGGPSSNLQFLWLRSGGSPYRYAGINYGAFNTNSFLTYHEGAGQLVTKFIAGLPGAQSELDAAPTILRITSAGTVGIGMSPSNQLDVSGTTRSSNVLVGGYLRDALTPSQFDISGGNISNSGTTTSTNAIVSGYLRNALTPTQFDLSSGTLYLSNRVLVGNGLRSAPAYTFSQDPSSGLFLSGTNSITVSIAGVKNVNFSNNIIEFSNSGSQVLWLSNNQLQAAAGTVAAPAYSFANDTSLGIYFVGANQLSFASAGRHRMTISNSNVGIGTTTPQTALDVCGGGIQIYGLASANNLSRPALATGTAAPDYEYRVRSFGGDDGFLRIRAGGYTTTTQASYIDLTGFNNSVTDMQRNIAFGTAGVERMRLNSNGFVGIGTQGPAYTLDLCESVAAATRFITAQFRNTDPNGQAAISVTGGGVADTSGLRFFHFPAAGVQGIYNSNTLPFHIYTNDVQRLTILSNGRVGIGTTAPTMALDISSSQNPMTVLRNSAGTANLRILGGGFADASGMELYHTSNAQGIFTSNTVPFYIYTSNTIRMTIDASGAVGIGTTTPATLVGSNGLVVAGNMNMGTAASSYRQFGWGGGGSRGFLYGAFNRLGEGVHIGYNYYNDNTSGIVNNTAGSTSRQSFGYGTIAMYTGGVNAEPTNLGYYQNSNGAVGIGTTAPRAGFQLSSNNAGFYNAAYDSSEAMYLVTHRAFRVETAVGGSAHFANLYLVTDVSFTNANVTNSAGAIAFASQNTEFAGYNVAYARIAGVKRGNFAGGLAISTMPDGDGVLREAVRFQGGRVGIQTSEPQYTLDISTAPTAASINMSTWTRTTAATTFFGVYSSTAVNTVVWTTSNSIDSNIITVGSNTGTYFVVNKSGIYAFNYYVNGTTSGNPIIGLDCSTNIAHDGLNSLANPQLAYIVGNSNNGQLSVSYTGFLPSNSGIYYKAKISGMIPVAGRNGARFTISFLGESPAVTGYPF